jgi:hypothetical protein
MKIKNLNQMKQYDCNKTYFKINVPKPNIIFNDNKLNREYNNYNIEIDTKVKISNSQKEELLNLEYWFNYFNHYPNYYIPIENRIFFIPYAFSGFSKKIIKNIILNYFNCEYKLNKTGSLKLSYSNTFENEIIINKNKFFISDIKSKIIKNIKSKVIDDSDSGSSYDPNKIKTDNSYKIVTLDFKNIPFDPIKKTYLKNIPNPDLPYENDFKNNVRKYKNYNIVLKGKINEKQMNELWNAEFWLNYYRHHDNNILYNINDFNYNLPKPFDKLNKKNLFNTIQYYVNLNCELHLENIRTYNSTNKFIKVNNPKTNFTDNFKNNSREYEKYSIHINSNNKLTNNQKLIIFNSEYWLNEFTHKNNLLYETSFNYKSKYSKKDLFLNIMNLNVKLSYKKKITLENIESIKYKFYPINYKKPNKLIRIENKKEKVIELETNKTVSKNKINIKKKKKTTKKKSTKKKSTKKKSTKKKSTKKKSTKKKKI